VRAAMNFALDNAPELALRLVGSLTFFFWLRGGFVEARSWVDRSLAASDGQPKQLIGKAHVSSAAVAERVGDVVLAAAQAEAAYAAFAETGDQQGIADALRERGKAAMGNRDFERARATYEELATVSDRIGDKWNGAIALNNLGDLALNTGDWERVVDLCGRSSAIRHAIGDRWGAALSLSNVVGAEIKLNRLPEASRSLRRALEDSLAVGALMVVAACVDTAAVLATALGREADAARLLGASDRLLEELGSVREGFEQRRSEATTAAVRTSLGENAFAAAFEQGRTMSPEEIADFALQATAVGEQSSPEPRANLPP
jgi:tetratricopeptide (TPR) repeat protein